mmetsp:Transcript_26868/g.71838  ORF Transcript_26868/g.71838 Transcript_26868/m.71838 type:complete len:299 (-) Transcript_26868:1041-1937(-)
MPVPPCLCPWQQVSPPRLPRPRPHGGSAPLERRSQEWNQALACTGMVTNDVHVVDFVSDADVEKENPGIQEAGPPGPIPSCQGAGGVRPRPQGMTVTPQRQSLSGGGASISRGKRAGRDRRSREAVLDLQHACIDLPQVLLAGACLPHPQVPPIFEVAAEIFVELVERGPEVDHGCEQGSDHELYEADLRVRPVQFVPVVEELDRDTALFLLVSLLEELLQAQLGPSLGNVPRLARVGDVARVQDGVQNQRLVLRLGEHADLLLRSRPLALLIQHLMVHLIQHLQLLHHGGVQHHVRM